MYLNKAFVFGNLTRDPEMKALPSGSKVVTFSLATNRVWKDAQGSRQESTDYHNIVVFGRQAETVNQYLRKGASAFIEGRMQTRSWDAPDGTKRYRTEIVADRVQFGPRAGGMSEAPRASSAASQAAPEDDSKEALATIDYGDEEINPDDIPF